MSSRGVSIGRAEGDGFGRRATWQGLPWQRGQTLAIVALLLVVLVGFLALVIDLGNVYAQRRWMQNAADAGALAGARALALEQGEDAVHAAVDQYAIGLNGARWYSATVEGQTVTVVVSRSVETYFASVIGFPRITVSAIAAAEYSGVSSVCCGMLAPLTISYTQFVPCTHPDTPEDPCPWITIWDGVPDEPGPGDVFSGARGWLNLGYGVGASDLSHIICDTEGTISRTVAVGDWINGDDGLKTSAVADFGNCRTGQEVAIPLYDAWRPKQQGDPDPGNLYYHIRAIAVFHIEEVITQGNPKGIRGYFLYDYVIPDGEPGGDDTGAVTVRLVR